MNAPHPTVDELLGDAVQLLTRSGGSRLDAQVLLAHVLGCTKTQLYTHGDQRIDPTQVRQFEGLLSQRVRGLPAAYLTGQREFWSLSLDVTPATLVPRPETETLVEYMLEKIPPDGIVLDAGTGSGAIALAIASERPDARVCATDISAEALAVAQTNAQKLDLPVSWMRSDWLSSIANERLDAVVANPPYIASNDPHLDGDGVRYEPRIALQSGADGLDALRQLIPGSHRCLRHDGWLGVEHGHDQGRAVRQLFEECGYREIRTIPDYAGIERVSLGQK